MNDSDLSALRQPKRVERGVDIVVLLSNAKSLSWPLALEIDAKDERLRQLGHEWMTHKEFFEVCSL